MTDTAKQPTCKECVGRQYAGRMHDLAALWAAYQRDPEEEVPELGTLDDYGLSFDYVAPGTFRDQKRGYWRYQLSTGGPGDEFRFYCDENRRPVRVEYWFLDWFDGARRTVRSGKDFELLCDLFAWFGEAGVVESTWREAQER